MAKSTNTESRRVFTLRFRNPRTFEMLRLAARHRKVSMNELVEEAVEEHLSVEAAFIEAQLAEALETVRRYHRQDQERDIAAFARAEVTEPDPLRSTGIAPTLDRNTEDPWNRDAGVVSPVE